MRGSRRLAAVALLGSALAGAPAAAGCLRGVNLSGAEFGTIPGRPNHDYAYPSADEFRRVAALGFSAIRLPFRWERLQPKPLGPLDPAELERLDATLAAARGAGLSTILDLHNFGHFGPERLGTPALPAGTLADVWARLAAHVKGDPALVLSLMNEPYDIDGPAWAEMANGAIAAIRRAGAANLILVPGTAYSGAHSWTDDLPTGNNGRDMLSVRDPAVRFAFDVHQYLDRDSSGRSAECSGAATALEGIGKVEAWARAHGRRAFLGEFASSAAPACLAALKAMAVRVDADPDHWVGWTAWGAGAWWPQDYVFNLQPTPAGERPQVAALAEAARAPARCDLAGHP